MVKKAPSRNQLMQPVLNALNNLGGSGSVREIYDEVVKLETLIKFASISQKRLVLAMISLVSLFIPVRMSGLRAWKR